MILLTDSQNAELDQRPGRDIEHMLRMLLDMISQIRLICFNDRDIQLKIVTNYLHGISRITDDEARSQALMAHDNGIKNPPQYFKVEFSTQAHGSRNIVAGIAAFKFAQEPK